MITIQLNNAENGIIKKVIDTQYNGVDQKVEITKIYELKEDRLQYFLRVTDLLEEIAEDLGLSLGGDFDGAQLKFDLDWGSKYTPNEEEVDEKIKDLNTQIKQLKDYKKSLKINGSDI